MNKASENLEFIVCAAIWYKDFPLSLYQPLNITTGFVLCGLNHASIIQQHVCLANRKQSQMGLYEQGFLTSNNRFVSRYEAAAMAIIANQVDITKSGKELFSEDLFTNRTPTP
jgi:hypothetical protein